VASKTQYGRAVIPQRAIRVAKGPDTMMSDSGRGGVGQRLEERDFGATNLVA